MKNVVPLTFVILSSLLSQHVISEGQNLTKTKLEQQPFDLYKLIQKSDSIFVGTLSRLSVTELKKLRQVEKYSMADVTHDTKYIKYEPRPEVVLKEPETLNNALVFIHWTHPPRTAPRLREPIFKGRYIFFLQETEYSSENKFKIDTWLGVNGLTHGKFGLIALEKDAKHQAGRKMLEQKYGINIFTQEDAFIQTLEILCKGETINKNTPPPVKNMYQKIQERNKEWEKRRLKKFCKMHPPFRDEKQLFQKAWNLYANDKEPPESASRELKEMYQGILRAKRHYDKQDHLQRKKPESAEEEETGSDHELDVEIK